MRKVYCGLAGLLSLAVVAQYYFAAVGAFAEPRQDSSFALHDVTGVLVIPVLSLLATVAAALAGKYFNFPVQRNALPGR